jgi:mitofusin
LAPAKVYLDNVLLDLEAIAKYNVDHFTDKGKHFEVLLEETGPAYQKLLQAKNDHLNGIKQEIESVSNEICNHTKKTLENLVQGNVSIILEFEPFMDSVEWNGALHVMQYAHELRSVASRLTSVRLRSCHTFAQNSCVEFVSKVEKAVSDCFDSPELRIDTGPIVDGLVPHTHISCIELSDYSLFDSSDKFDILKDYLPSLTIISTSYFGYKSIITALSRNQSASVGKLLKLFFTGLAVTGFLILTRLRAFSI